MQKKKTVSVSDNLSSLASDGLRETSRKLLLMMYIELGPNVSFSHHNYHFIMTGQSSNTHII